MTIRFACALALLFAAIARADAWQLDTIETPGPILELTELGGEPRIATAAGWFAVAFDGNHARLESAQAPPHAPMPPDALPDGRLAAGQREIARAWFAEPTLRYGHGVLGDTVESGSLVVERPAASAKRFISAMTPCSRILCRASPISRRKIVVVKSYLAAGSALTVVGERDGRYAVLAETPPIGTPNRWLNPAGIADFDGDGFVDIALVRMPHALGRLELWRSGQVGKNQ